VQEFMTHGPQIVFHSGDIIADGNDLSDWATQWFGPVCDMNDRVPVVPTFGNHDGSRRGNLWRFYPLPSHAPDPDLYFYSFNYGPLHVVVYDVDCGSSRYGAGSPQYAHLEADLQANRSPFTIVFFHKPVYSSGIGHGGMENPVIARDLQPLFEKYGVDIVLYGHDHIYERSFKDGVHLICSGGGGAPVTPAGWNVNDYSVTHNGLMYCYCVLEISGTTLKVNTFALGNAPLDSFQVDRSKPEVHILQPDGTYEVFTGIRFVPHSGHYELTGPPSAFTAVSGQKYRINLRAKDLDSNATISLFLDDDDTGLNGTPIATGIPEDGTRHFDWQVSGIAPGSYYIYATISDGTHQSHDYSHFKITVQ
jgi:predicted phosphodiesterase